MQTNTPEIAELHRYYCELYGTDSREFPLTMSRIWAWDAWLGQGHTKEDLELVMNRIKAGVEKKTRFPGALRFHNLIENHASFSEELSEAKAFQRNRPPPQTVKDRYVTKPLGTAKPVAQVIAQSKDISELVRKAHEACEKGGVA